MTRKAICCCGACSVEVEGEPILNALCHCTNCKRRTGSAFGWSVYVGDSQVVRHDGDLRAYEIARANRLQRRWFCTACGTTLFWKVSWRPDEIGIAGGRFEPALPSPSVTVSNEGRCSWLGLPADWRTAL